MTFVKTDAETIKEMQPPVGLQTSERIELGQVFAALWKRKGLIFLCTLLMAVIFFLAVSRITPLYSARASVMLDSRSVQVLTSDNIVSDLNVNNPVMDTEAAVLRSNVLLAKVVAQLGPEMLAPIDPALEPPGITDQIKDQIRSALSNLLPGSDSAKPNAPLLDDAAREERRLVGALRRSLSIRREGQSYLISVIAETPDPALSERIANTLVQTYIQDQIDMRNLAIRDATSFLAEQIETMRLSLEEAEGKIEDYRSQQVADAGASLDTLERQMLELSTQLALAKADLAQTEARYSRIQAVIETSGIQAGAELLSSAYVLSLREQISSISRREAELATRFSDDHPERAAVRAEISQLQDELAQEVRQILANLENDLAVAGARVDSITSSVNGMEQRVSAISRTNVELRQLEREADAIRENYQQMLTRFSETQSSEKLSRADARQVERATLPGSPSSPRVMLLTTFGAALGFALGLLLTFYLSVTKAGFATAAQLEQATGKPVVTALLSARLGDRKGLLRVLEGAPYSPFTERLRQLWTLLMLQHNRKSKGTCIQVTSSVAAESKTSTTVALAFLEARAGGRCLVVDFDLRRSSLAAELGYDAPYDLADALRGTCTPAEAIAPAGELGFDLLTLKAPAPRLGDQVDSSRFAALIEGLKPNYDLILIDTAPVLLIAETLRVSRLVDSVLLLVRQEKTHRKAVLQSLAKLRSVGSAPVTLAMTFTDPKSEQETYGAYESYRANVY